MTGFLRGLGLSSTSDFGTRNSAVMVRVNLARSAEGVVPDFIFTLLPFAKSVSRFGLSFSGEVLRCFQAIQRAFMKQAFWVGLAARPDTAVGTKVLVHSSN